MFIHAVTFTAPRSVRMTDEADVQNSLRAWVPGYLDERETESFVKVTGQYPAGSRSVC